MISKTKLIFALATLIVGAACGSNPTAQPAPTIPLVTATLPPTSTLPPSETPLPPPPTSTLTPIEGMTTTQVNVRAEPSTNGATLGILTPSAKVQILAKDSGGNWFQILYVQGTDGKGWIAAQYVQVAVGAEIPVLGAAAGSESAPNGVIIQQVNVRSGPGTDFNSLGILNPQDAVTLIGKDSNGTWLQIEFASGPDGKGWVTAAYVKSNEMGNLPIVSQTGDVVGTGTPTGIPATITPTVIAATDNGDSASSPAVNVVFSPSGSSSLIYTSDVSVPQGDSEDWIAFTPYTSAIEMQLDCVGNGNLHIELWQNSAPLSNWGSLECGGKLGVNVTAGQPYLVRVQAMASGNGLESVRFTLNIASVR
ncbi:MAG TPA: SH3 domain-containing protein [Anaerolineales bacterium]|nr:SH3 domain-containing protein [Anaerolineales bacterium]